MNDTKLLSIVRKTYHVTCWKDQEEYQMYDVIRCYLEIHAFLHDLHTQFHA